MLRKAVVKALIVAVIMGMVVPAGCVSRSAEVGNPITLTPDGTVTELQYELALLHRPRSIVNPARTREAHWWVKGELRLSDVVVATEVQCAIFIGDDLLLAAVAPHQLLLIDATIPKTVVAIELDTTPVFVGPSRSSDFLLITEHRKLFRGDIKGVRTQMTMDGPLEPDRMWFPGPINVHHCDECRADR